MVRKEMKMTKRLQVLHLIDVKGEYAVGLITKMKMSPQKRLLLLLSPFIARVLGTRCKHFVSCASMESTAMTLPNALPTSMMVSVRSVRVLISNRTNANVSDRFEPSSWTST